MTSFFAEYWDVIAFYVIVVLLLYIFRSKFEFQGIVALLKTKLGLAFMTNTGKRHPVFWHRLGIISIILCFAGMVFITIYLFIGLYNLFFVPDAPPTLSPVIPGVKIPGSPIDFPLWYTLIGLFFAVIVHEAAHGIWSAAYNIKIKSSGFAFFGPLPGAFVEPDEKTLVKRPKREQLAIFSAGPFANMILAIIVFILMLGIAASALTLVSEEGVTVGNIQNASAAAAAGIPANTTITSFDGKPIRNTAELTTALGNYKPGDTVTLTANNTTYTATLGSQEADETKPFLGVLNVKTATELKDPSQQWLLSTLLVLMNVCFWTYVISLGIGIANLLPIGPIDGGRMFYITLLNWFPEAKAKQLWTRWSMLLFLIVLVLVFVPILKAVL